MITIAFYSSVCPAWIRGEVPVQLLMITISVSSLSFHIEKLKGVPTDASSCCNWIIQILREYGSFSGQQRWEEDPVSVFFSLVTHKVPELTEKLSHSFIFLPVDWPPGGIYLCGPVSTAWGFLFITSVTSQKQKISLWIPLMTLKPRFLVRVTTVSHVCEAHACSQSLRTALEHSSISLWSSVANLGTFSCKSVQGWFHPHLRARYLKNFHLSQNVPRYYIRHVLTQNL